MSLWPPFPSTAKYVPYANDWAIDGERRGNGMASWTDRELTDAAREHAGTVRFSAPAYETLVEAFKAGASWADKHEPKEEK